MEDLRKGSKVSEEVVDTGDLDDFLGDMDKLQVTKAENTETQKEEVTESQKNNEEAPNQEDAGEPKVEKEEVKEPENVEEVVSADLDDFLGDMDKLQVNKVDVTEEKKEEVAQTNNEVVVDNQEADEKNQVLNSEDELKPNSDFFSNEVHVFQSTDPVIVNTEENLEKSEVVVEQGNTENVESPKIQETQKTNETFQVVNETNNTQDNTFVKVDTTQDQNNTQKVEQDNVEASENVLQVSPVKEQNSTENVVSNDSAPIVEAKPTDQMPEGFKIESPFADIDPVGKSVLDIQKEILTKVEKLKAEGNKFFSEKSYFNAIDCWSRGLRSFQWSQLGLVDDEDLKSKHHIMQKILFSNLGIAYFEEGKKNEKNQQGAKNNTMAIDCLKGAVRKIESGNDELRLNLGNIKVYKNLANVQKVEKYPREAAKAIEQAKSLLLQFPQEVKTKPEYYTWAIQLKEVLEDINIDIEKLVKKEQKMYSKMFETPLNEEKNASESNVNVSTVKAQEGANNDTLKETKKSNKNESSNDWGHKYNLIPLLLGGAGAASYFGLGKLLEKNPELISNHHRQLLAMGTGVSVTGLIVPKETSLKLAFGSLLVGLGIYVGGKLIKG